MYKAILNLIISGLFLLSGCSDSQKSDVAIPKQSKAEKPDVELISVNGQKLTKKGLEDRIAFIVKMNALMNPKMSQEDAQRLAKMLKTGSRQVFIREVVLSDYLKAENVQIASAAIEKEQGRLLSKMNMKKAKIWDLKKKVRPYEAMLDAYILARACEVTAREHILSQNPTNLPAQWGEGQIAMAKAYNERMALTNALVYARATNVWEQLRKGADFSEMARKYTEVPMEAKDGGAWGQLELRQLEPDDDLVEWAKKLKVGEFSPPIIGDNGLMIMRIDEMKGADYQLSRIYFRLPMFATLRSAEELEKRKLAEIKGEIVERKIKSLIKAAKIVKPKKNLKAKPGNKAKTKKENKK